MVTRSNAKVEFRSLAQGICKLLWIKIILLDLGIKIVDQIKLYCDNKYAISIAHNLVHHDQTKLVKIDQHFIKEKIKNGEICIPYIASRDQLVDILTKGLPRSVFQLILSKLVIENIFGPT